ncbi:DUF2442 domain-containing protein [Rhodopseudomonas palustris]|nr:DUF2442 domain-containing protein [Rhodopseudomonas palustris]
MTISATSIRFDDHTMWVDFSDGRTLGVPLAWFSQLPRRTLGQTQSDWRLEALHNARPGTE